MEGLHLQSLIGEAAVEGYWQDADEIEEIRQYREALRSEAEAVVAQQQDLLRRGEFDHVTPDVDAISTARRYLLEFDPQRRQELVESILIDARTTLYEASSKNEAELFPEYEMHWGGDGFYIFGNNIAETVQRGLSAVASQTERQRRINEYVEAGTPSALVEAGVHQEKALVTVSPPVDGSDQLMIRYSWFDDRPESLTLTTQQLSVPAAHYSQKDIARVFGEKEDTDIDFVAKQIVVDQTSISNVMDVARILDDVAEENLVLGCKIESDFLEKDSPYDLLHNESAERRLLLEKSAQELAQYSLELADKDMDTYLANYYYQRKVEELLHHVGQQEPLIAQRSFDEETAALYELALQTGEGAAAEEIRAQARLRAPEVMYCGAGSCGLQAANPMETQMAAKLGLSLEGGIVKFEDGSCGECGRSEVFFDQDGRAACLDCYSVRENGSTRRSQFRQKAA